MEHSKKKVLLFVLCIVVVVVGFYIFYTFNTRLSNKESILPADTLEKEIETNTLAKENKTTQATPVEYIDVDSTKTEYGAFPYGTVFKLINKEEYFNQKNKAPAIPDAEHDPYDEAYFLNKYPQVVRIDDKCFDITLKNGSRKKLCGEPKINYSYSAPTYIFSGYIPKLGYWFHGGYMEGSIGLVVDEETGEGIKTLMGKPVVSPNGKKFVSTSIDLDASYNHNGFEVWEKTEGSYSLKLRFILEDYANPNRPKIFWGATDPVWVNDNSFYFVKSTADYSSDFTKYYDEYAQFSF